MRPPSARERRQVALVGAACCVVILGLPLLLAIDLMPTDQRIAFACGVLWAASAVLCGVLVYGDCRTWTGTK